MLSVFKVVVGQVLPISSKHVPVDTEYVEFKYNAVTSVSASYPMTFLLFF